MKTNFFEQIAGLAFQGNLNLTIARHAGGNLAVSVYLATEITDNAGKTIPPMLLKGMAAELDEEFFSTIATPLQKTAQLFANMDAYQQSLDRAKAQSKEEQEKKSKTGKPKPAAIKAEGTDDEDAGETDDLFTKQEAEKQEKAERRQHYDQAMAQITELNKLCRYEEAIALLPQVEDYPEKAGEINRKRTELQKRKTQYEELMQEL